MKAKVRKEKMWAIYGTCGLYCGTALTRREAIAEHCKASGETWDECRKLGDVALKVIIIPDSSGGEEK